MEQLDIIPSTEPCQPRRRGKTFSPERREAFIQVGESRSKVEHKMLHPGIEVSMDALRDVSWCPGQIAPSRSFGEVQPPDAGVSN
ncbi:MAG: hypothetical protein M5T61_09985 [Acidimicrobiia bacterium]|nr:hypothetical protein [Acidimicrobiia bacterium]